MQDLHFKYIVQKNVKEIMWSRTMNHLRQWIGTSIPAWYWVSFMLHVKLHVNKTGCHIPCNSKSWLYTHTYGSINPSQASHASCSLTPQIHFVMIACLCLEGGGWAQTACINDCINHRTLSSNCYVSILPYRKTEHRLVKSRRRHAHRP